MGSLWYVSDEGALALMSQLVLQSVTRHEVRDELVTPTQLWLLPEELRGRGDRDFTPPYFWISGVPSR